MSFSLTYYFKLGENFLKIKKKLKIFEEISKTNFQYFCKKFGKIFGKIFGCVAKCPFKFFNKISLTSGSH